MSPPAAPVAIRDGEIINAGDGQKQEEQDSSAPIVRGLEARLVVVTVMDH